jgi:anti-sigma-K factor RskA
LSNGEHLRLEELELLALGALPEDEATALEAHVSGCSVCAANLAQARGHAALLAFSVKQERPSATVKLELIGRVRANQAAGQADWPSGTRRPDTEGGAAKRRSQARGSWWNWVLVTAAVALALLSFGLSWQNRRITAELAKERKAAVSLVLDRERIEQLVGTLTALDTLTVKLAGSGDTANATGTVKFNAKSGMVLYSADLPALPPDKSYQMWLVPASGAPISAGLLGPGGHTWGNLWTAQVPANTQAKAFAVTIEPVGGMPQPTGPKVLIGTN